jgi:hypothetical protein
VQLITAAITGRAPISSPRPRGSLNRQAFWALPPLVRDGGAREALFDLDQSIPHDVAGNEIREPPITCRRSDPSKALA